MAETLKVFMKIHHLITIFFLPNRHSSYIEEGLMCPRIRTISHVNSCGMRIYPNIQTCDDASGDTLQQKYSNNFIPESLMKKGFCQKIKKFDTSIFS